MLPARLCGWSSHHPAAACSMQTSICHSFCTALTCSCIQLTQHAAHVCIADLHGNDRCKDNAKMQQQYPARVHIGVFRYQAPVHEYHQLVANMYKQARDWCMQTHIKCNARINAPYSMVFQCIQAPAYGAQHLDCNALCKTVLPCLV